MATDAAAERAIQTANWLLWSKTERQVTVMNVRVPFWLPRHTANGWASLNYSPH